MALVGRPWLLANAQVVKNMPGRKTGLADAEWLAMLCVDQLSAAIERLDGEVDRGIRPFSAQLQRLLTISGVGRRTAEVIIAEVGVDMRRSATAGHLASWAGMCPGNHDSGGRRRSGRARKGNRALRAALCETGWAAAHTKTGYLPAQYRHLLRTFGKKGQTRAVFAVGHSIPVIAWHLLANDCDYADLGAEQFTRHAVPDARKHYLIRQLEALGHKVTVEPAPA